MAESVDGSSTGRPQLHQPRLAEVVAGVLRNRIVEGQLADGARLPKQDDLLREFRVSRPSLREALRILESEGLLTVQRGNVGGAIVRAPNARTSAYMFGLVLQSRHVRLRDLALAVYTVEPTTAALCALREDRHQTVVPHLRDCLQQAEAAMGDLAFTALSRRFHEEMVRSCGNETLILMLGTLEIMWSEQERSWARRARDAGSLPALAGYKAAISAHRAVLRAIERGDGDRAAKVVKNHLLETQHFWLTDSADLAVQAVPTRALPLLP